MKGKSTLGYCLLVTVMLAGCGGGGGSASIPPDANALVDAGTSQLNSALSGGSIKQTDVKSAYGNFKQAYAIDPTNPRAAMGYALTECVQAAANSAGVFVTGLFPSVSANSSRLNLLSKGLVVTPEISTLQQALPIGWHLEATKNQSRSIGSLLPSTIRQILIALQPSLSNVVTALSDANLTALEAKPMILTMYVDGKITNVKVGKAEGLILRGAAQGILGLINLVVAYDLDFGTYSWSTDLLPAIKGTAVLTTTSFLPAGTFATLTSTGQTSLKNFGTATAAGMTDEIAAIDAQKARKTTPWLLGVSTTPAALTSDRTNAVNYLGLLTSVKSITFTPTGSTSSVTTHINLPAWFAKAPTDLRSIFGSVSVTKSTKATTITMQKGSIKDRTYAGLFPDGITDAVLYGRTNTLAPTDTFTRSNAAGFAGVFLDAITALK
jgi:hypothetical protein